MKILKVLLLIISITILSACSSTDTVEVISFDRIDFEYTGMSDDDFMQFEGGIRFLEVFMDDEGSITASYEKGLDIYLIYGEEDSYIIRRNGVLITACSGEGEDLRCTGSEQVDFQSDIATLFALYEKDNSTLVIVISSITAVVLIAAVLIGAKHFGNFSIRNIKITRVFIVRTLIIIIVIALAAIVVFSL